MRKVVPTMAMMFGDRSEAGRHLAQALGHCREHECVVLAIPRGGVPVGYEVSQHLECVLDVVVPRKLPIPWSPEAGFGAVTPDGTRVLNERMVRELGLTDSEIDRIAQDVLEEVKRREQVYRGTRPYPDLSGRWAILVDDGLATGYTMLAAVQAVRKRDPARVVVAAPVAPRSSAEEVEEAADELVVLRISDEMPFAVASYYRLFPDMSDAEVTSYLETQPAG